MPEFRMKTVCAQPKKNLRARLAKPESVIDRSKRMPWTLQLLQDLYFMAQESTIHCKLQKTFFFPLLLLLKTLNAFFSEPCFQSRLSNVLENYSTDLDEILHRCSRYNLLVLGRRIFFFQLQLF